MTFDTPYSSHGALNQNQRKKVLERLSQTEFDIVVIGGGITGAGIALDAALRGFSVLLLEQNDWAQGTSSRSSKLIHGGLRYLEKFEFDLVRESLREQTLLIERLCPHLVRPLRFVLPLHRRSVERFYFGAGLFLYDLLAGRRALPRHRHLSSDALQKSCPSLREDRFSGAIEYFDAQMDDSRMVVTILRTAAAQGASVLSRMQAIGFTKEHERIVGVRALCRETNTEFHIRGRQIISAAGVWTESVQRLLGERGLRVRTSKGVHLVVPRRCIEGDAALILKTAKSILLAIPWREHWIIGTTDTPWSLDLANPSATQFDVDYLLREINSVLRTALTQEDICSVYTGLRPLLHEGAGETTEISRKHRVLRTESGLIAIAGGKYTTYRVMAKDAVDLAAKALAPDDPPDCRSAEAPLVGAARFFENWASRETLAQASGLALHQIETLLTRYGDRIADLLWLMQRDPSLRRPLAGAAAYLAVEVVYAATHEGVLHLGDVLERRTHIHMETPDRGLRAASEVAELLAPVLGWDAETTATEKENYTLRIAREFEAEKAGTDEKANRILISV